MITSFAQLLDQQYMGKLDENASQFISQITGGASRMGIMISDLLRFDRIQTRGVPFGPVDLYRALQGALANLAVTIRETSASVTTDSLPTATGDGSQVIQVFQNLVGNAIKYRKESELPVIKVGVVRSQQDNTVHLYVRDNDIGIDPKHFEKLFLPFHRLHPAGKYPGTGIGLATCKKVVERHGGQIWVESRPGEGSTFHFTLPKPLPA